MPNEITFLPSPYHQFLQPRTGIGESAPEQSAAPDVSHPVTDRLSRLVLEDLSFVFHLRRKHISQTFAYISE